MSNEIFPVVEVLGDGTDWKIRNNGQAVVRNRQTLYAPTSHGALSAAIRSMQLGRAKWGLDYSKVKTCAGLDILQAVDDLRVRLELLDAGVNVNTCHMSREYINFQTAIFEGQNDWRGLLTLLVSSHPSAEHVALYNYIANNSGRKRLEAQLIVGLTNQACRGLAAARTDELVIKWAEELERTFENYSLADVTHRRGRGLGELANSFLDEMFMKGLSGLFDRMMDEDGEEEGNGSPGSSGDEGPWGRMTIDTPPKNIPIKDKMAAWRRTNNEEGTYLRQVWRISTDRQIFGMNRRRRGGSVLIDGSGSMSLSPEQVYQIADAAPAVTVAIYSGDNEEGILRELVRNSKRCDEELFTSPCGGGNVIDVPALRDWLAKQPHPRIWVSDGGVTGAYDDNYKAVTRAAFYHVKRNGIIRVNNMKDALSLFKLMANGGYQVHPAQKRNQERKKG